MIDIWRYDFNKLIESKLSGIDIIRLCVYHQDILKYKEIYKKLFNYGYKISLNIIAVSHLKDTDINEILFNINKIKDNIHILYVADSFGSLNIDSTKY